MTDDNNNDIDIKSNYSNFIQIVFLKVMFQCGKASYSFNFFESITLQSRTNAR